MEAIKTVLKEAQAQIESLINLIESGDIEGVLESGEKHTIEASINLIDLPCKCDDYVGFECGCRKRLGFVESAKEELLRIF